MQDPADAPASETVLDDPSVATAGLAGPATPRWVTWLWTWGPAVPAGALALLFALSYEDSYPGAILAVLTAAAGLAAGVRFRAPVPAWGVATAVVPAAMLVEGDSSLYLLAIAAPALPLAALATAWPAGRSLRAAAITAVVLAISGVISARMHSAESIAVLVAFSTLIVVAAWLVGYTLQSRAQYAAALEARARHLERERDARSARAVADERVRIARDLHDLVSHNVAVMVVQAEAADVVWDQDRERARSAVRAVSETGRSAMGELRAMLHAMRLGRDGDEPDRRAQEGLDALPRVVEQVRASGQRVELALDGDLAAVPATVGGSLLRIVQEALTNVLRHAAAAHARVAVSVTGDRVVVRVEDDGIGLEGSAARRGDALDVDGAGGHGLIGIRERVAVLGGRMTIGPATGGGTRLDVDVPRGGEASARVDRQAATR